MTSSIVACLLSTSAHAASANLITSATRIYAVSDDQVQTLYIPFDQLPRDTKDATIAGSGALDNWPKRSDRCSGYGIGGAGGLKAFPILPMSALVGTDNSAPYGDIFFVSPGYDGYSFNKYGAYRGASGDCKTTGAADYSVYNARGIRALRDAGTSAIPAWSDVAGYSIAPTAYGGWATNVSLSGPSWKPAAQIHNDIFTDSACRQSADPDDDAHHNDGRHNGTYWVYAADASGNGTGLGVAYDAFFPPHGTGEGSVMPIWGRYCSYGSDLAPNLLQRAGYPVGDQSSLLSKSAPIDTSPSNRTGIYNNGMTLFRKVVKLEQEDLDRIQLAQDRSSTGGLYIDMVADDFYDLYINGVHRKSNVINATNADLTVTSGAEAKGQLRFQLKINADTLHVGDNLIAIAVMDKTVDTTAFFSESAGIGLGFALVLNEPTNVTPTVALSQSNVVVPGQSLVAKAHVAYVGNKSAQFTYERRVWYEKTGNTSYDAGERSVYFDNNGGSSVDRGASYDLNDYTIPSVGPLPGETHVCTALMLVASNDATTVGEPNPAVTCVLIGKFSYVQIWGSDLRVGSPFVSGVASTTSQVTGVIGSKPGGATTEMDSNAASGLWKTGVDAHGVKVTVPYAKSDDLRSLYTLDSAKAIYNNKAQTDLHWEITKVMRPDGDSDVKKTCQYSFDATSGLIAMDRTTPAYIIVEQPPSGGIGAAYGTRQEYIVGSGAVSMVADGDRPWKRTSAGASWIGQNIFGVDFSSTNDNILGGMTGPCKDPAVGNDPAEMDRANVYVFKLKTPFSIEDGVDLSTAELRIQGAIDNRAKAFVNGKQLLESSSGSTDWQEPGFSGLGASFRFKSDPSNPAFMNSGNELVLEVQSTGTFTGLMIEDISMSGLKTVSSPTAFGSWAEYGVIAPSGVTSVASASGFMGPSAIASDQGSWSSLTFANTPALGSFGGASSIGQIPDVKGYLERNGAKAGLTVVHSTGAVNLSTYEPNKVYIVDGTVTIAGDIANPNATVPHDNQLTQMIIIAKDININSNVSKVDAWLIATSGAVDTCADGPAQLTMNDCSTKLTINGPVMAKGIKLRRTGGDNGDPAEVINLRSDAYLWAQNISDRNGSYHTVYSRELAPRY